MGPNRHTHQRAKVDCGSVEITDERVIYTDAGSVKWRLYDFARSGGAVVSVRPGSVTASIRIFVRQDCRERRRAEFSPRDDTLTPRFNYNTLSTSAIRRQGKWIYLWSEQLAGDGAQRSVR